MFSLHVTTLAGDPADSQEMHFDSLGAALEMAARIGTRWRVGGRAYRLEVRNAEGHALIREEIVPGG
ncbi:MAG TPA: hypothetical protein VEH84_12910 [Alphaproteobacteria bacterium]|nr:hypothetical protein [Alphaproteobacteria bacterium]